MLDRGLTPDGAAQALGWTRARVNARVKLLDLPETAQEMIGAGRLPASSVDQLRAIATVSAPLLEALVAYLDDGNEWAAERLAREPGWILDSALRQTGERTVFAEHLTQLHPSTIQELRLGKKTEALLDEATTLAKQLDRYAYGSPAIRFTDEDIDQARAAGVVIEFERSAPIIVDRPLFRELAKAAVKRTVTELKDRVAQREQEKKANRHDSASTPTDPLAEAHQEEQRQLRDLAQQAHGVNLDIGRGLLHGLSLVDPSDMDVARFFVYALLGSDYDDSPYTQSGERVAHLAVSGIRLVIDQFRADATKTLKDETKGKLRIDYGDPRDPKEPIKWLWRFIDGAHTAGELYGRALVVIAAEQYASRLIVPTSQRSRPTGWGSHKDCARKALTKLAGPHLPASLKQLEKAIAKIHAEHDQAVSAAHAQPERPPSENDAGEDDAGEDEIAGLEG